MNPCRNTLLALLIGALALVAFGDSIPADDRPAFKAARTEMPPLVDGDLSDPAWQPAEEITGFIQRNPDEGKPATQPSFVRVVYDQEAIYIAARLVDSEPVTTRLGRRDNNLSSDWFKVYLDPHHDRQTGVGFWVNPSNVQIDMVLYNDGWDDWDWDAVWSSATAITEDGWNVEMRIPYSQLRFPDRNEHTWGINFIRRIDRINEDARLVFVPKTETGFVSRFADLEGIEGIRPSRSLELMPYVVSRADLKGTVSPDDPFRDSTELDGSLGLDLKYSLTSNLTLTGTINPDFGQVEVDPAVVNLSQYELFFPEKRPFFVEGSSLFRFGQGGSNNNFGFNFSQPTLFYSRRIGRAPQGTGFVNADWVDAPGDSTILGAAKLTGKFGNGWSIGLLDAVTQEETARFLHGDQRGSQTVEPMTNYLISRMAKEFSPKARIGTLFTAVNRDLPDELDGSLRSSGYLAGVDGHRFFGNKDVIWEWFVAGTHVEGSEEAIARTQQSPAHYYGRPDAAHVDLDPSRTSLSGWAASTMVAKQTGRWKYNFKVQSYSPGFETNDVGFMQRADMVASHAVLMYNNPDPGKRVRERNIWVGKYQNWNHDGDLLANGLFGRGFVQFHNYWYAFGSAGGNTERDDDRLTRGGPVAQRPSDVHGSFGFGSDSRKPISFETWAGFWEDAEGSRDRNVGLYLTWKPTSNLSMTLNPGYYQNFGMVQYLTTVPDSLATETYGRRYVFAEIDQRRFDMGTRLDWTFSPRLSLQLYLQPFIASGDYENFKQLERPRRYEYFLYGVDGGTVAFDETSRRYTIDPDAGGPAAPFSFGNPDFNFRSVRGSAVLRWEFLPGSAAYFVWNENRAAFANVGDFRFGRDFSAIGDAPSDDVFMVKISYWWAS